MTKISKQIQNMFEVFQNDKNTKIASARNTVINAFFQCNEAVSSTDIFNMVKDDQRVITKAFVFKVMKKLCFYNIAETHETDSGKIVYTHEHIKCNTAQFRCIKCNEKQHIDIDHNELCDITGKGFSPITMFSHDLTINGLCEHCKPDSISIPLSHMQENTSAVIFEILGDSEKIKRFSDMGFSEGVTVELLNIISNSLIVKIAGNRLSISQNLAKDILVISNA